MRRTSVMTLGFVLVFAGAQMGIVETFVLTSRFSVFLAENARQVESQSVATSVLSDANYNSPYYQASNSTMVGPQLAAPISAGPKEVTPPKWLCWPVLCLGGVVFLHGFARKHD